MKINFYSLFKNALLQCLFIYLLPLADIYALKLLVIIKCLSLSSALEVSSMAPPESVHSKQFQCL